MIRAYALSSLMNRGGYMIRSIGDVLPFRVRIINITGIKVPDSFGRYRM